MEIDKELLNDILQDKEKTIKFFGFIRDFDTLDIYKKYLLFKKSFYPEFFKNKDTEEHREAVIYHIMVYQGLIKTFTNLAYRNFGKTTDLKILVVFFIACDFSKGVVSERVKNELGLNETLGGKRKFMKFLSDDKENAKQFVMDCYNLLSNRKINQYFGVFGREMTDEDDEDLKKEETKTAFITNNGVKMYATTTKVNQRGSVQKASRPDFVIYDDIESKETIRSIVKTKAIWDKMEESYTGMADDGGSVYLGNYISRKRNIQKLINRAKKDPERHKLMITSIFTGEVVDRYREGKATLEDVYRLGIPQWEERYPREKAVAMMEDVDDPSGEYLCIPSDLEDSYFLKQNISWITTTKPILKDTEYEIYERPKERHRYVVGIDPAGGNGGDFGAIVVIDITKKLQKKVVLVYKSRFKEPQELGELGLAIAKKYNDAFYIFESNLHGQVIARWFKDQDYNNYYKTTIFNEDRNKETEKLGFETNGKTKPIILSNLQNELRFRTLYVNSEYIFSQLEDFPREYAETTLIDEELGHFDVLMALAIALIGADFDLGEFGIEDNKDKDMSYNYDNEEDKDESTDDFVKNIEITDLDMV